MTACDDEKYFSGRELRGDDFGPLEIADWFAGEVEGYADLGAKQRSDYRYEYHQLNAVQHYEAIRGRSFRRALGIGSAYGDEFEPIAEFIGRITILEPSSAFSDRSEINGVPCDYVNPTSSGCLPFAEGCFDLITCFGVLHHIPNVSFVIGELHRVLAQNGMLLIREPIVSMGDWRQPRAGLTRNERGIPLSIFDEIVSRSGFAIRRRRLCDFRPLIVALGHLGVQPFNMKAAVIADDWICNAFRWKLQYHRTTWLAKLAPASIAYVLEREQ